MTEGTHMTPRAVAQKRIRERIGRVYPSDKDVYNADGDTIIIGMLHLILDELQARTDKSEEEREDMEKHASWLIVFRPKVDRVIAEMERQLARIEKITGAKLDVPKLSPRLYNFTSWAYRKWGSSANKELDRCQGIVKQLKAVKTIKDLATLPGVGRTTIKKLMAKSEAAND